MIKNIQLTNFRNHTEFTADLGSRVLLIGPNGSGKSTVLDAIEWGLRGQCRGVDGRGVGQKDLIQNGTEQAAVTLTVDRLGPITRSISRAGAAKSSMPSDMILGKLKVSDAMLHAVLQGRAFFNMGHADAKALLMDLLHVTVAPADLPGCGYTDQDFPDGVDLPTLEAGYAAAFDQRKTQKQVIKSLAVPDFKVNKVLDKGDLDILKAHEKRARAQLQEAVQLKERATNALARLEDQAAAIRKNLEQKGGLQGNLGAQIEGLGRHKADLAAAKQALTDLEAQPGESMTELRGQATATAALVEKLKVHSPDRGCVLSASIPCLTGAAAFVDQVKDLTKTVKDLEAKIQAGTKHAEAVAAARQSVKDAERQVTYHQNQVERVTQQIKDLDDAAVKLPDIDQQIVQARQHPDLNPETVAALEREYDVAIQAVADLRVYLTNKQNHADAKAKLAKAEADLEILEARVALLGPKGIRATALAAAVSGFEEAINAALDRFGFTLAFQIEPWNVFISDDRNGTRRFEMLSAGEQLWSGLAFQLALAMMSGLNFCLLDATEAVVGANRALLTDLVMTAPVDQIIVAMAKAEGDPSPELNGLQVIRLEGVATASAVA